MANRILSFIFCSLISFSSLFATGHNSFRVQKDAAQYKESSYSNVVDVARNISLEEAFDIAEQNPEIDYFVYTKGWQMVLEIPPHVQFDLSQDPFGLVTSAHFLYDSGEKSQGYCRVFQVGDVVFFKKEGMWLGSAPGLADVYFKNPK